MALIIDYTIDKIIKDIQSKFKDANGNPLEYDTIVKIIESQIDCTVKGMANGDTIVWKYFGTFTIKRKRMEALNKKYLKEGRRPTIEDTGLSKPISFKTISNVL